MDGHIGRLLEALRQAPAFDDTIFHFSSDNGLAPGSHGLYGKQNVRDMKTG